ncbi:MAG TPA: protein kinase [Longimicrobiales bacterium]|nr:protein kinase [Longimicrobiales bacterium]
MEPTQPDELPRIAELQSEYEFLRELGRGGTAVVYLARERELNRLVAIKLIRATYVEDTEAAARLVREAQVISMLQHPNIVVLYGTRRLRDGSLALLMQYVQGHTLKAEIRSRGPLPFDDIRRILQDLAAALAYAHTHRIVHRDIKPENIYLDSETGVTRLSDFGIARTVDGSSNLTLPGSAIGTPTYMSPEQIDGGALDGRSDLYSLALVGYEMATGRPPWDGEGLFGVIYRQKHDPLPDIRTVRPDAPDWLVNALAGALAKDPRRRWADAAEMREALAGWLAEPAVEAAPAAAPGEPPAFAVPPASAGPVSPDAPTVVFRPGEVLALAPHSTTAPAARDSAQSLATFSVQITSAGGPVPQVAVTPKPRRTRTAAVATAVLLLGAAAGGVAMAVRPEPADGPATEAAATAAALPAPGESAPLPVTNPADAPIAPGTEALATGLDSLLATAATMPPDSASVPAAAVAAAVAPRGGTALSGQAGAAVQVAVSVRDDQGSPLAGALVAFAAESGGRVAPDVVATDDDGTATTMWVLGGESRQRLVASVRDADLDPVVFTATVGPPPLSVRTALAAGGTHTCELDARGNLACWGGNDRGQLGDGSSARRGEPAAVELREPFAMVSPGVSHTCAITVSGRAYCWGANSHGQLGTGGGQSAQPQPVRTDVRFSAIATGTQHTCALDREGRLFCWGGNGSGQLGDASGVDRAVPTRVAGERRFRSMTLGWQHTCALTAEGTAWCWGRNSSGELGIGGTESRLAPAVVRGGDRFRAITAGGAHTCGLRTDGTVVCWGQNTYGQLGTGGADTSTPTPVESAERYSVVTAGGVHTCAITAAGEAHCWGRNAYGQVGDGTTTDRSQPAPVADMHRFATIHASGAHTCGVTTAGERLCWGFNLEGQLGDGTRTNQPRPVRVRTR